MSDVTPAPVPALIRPSKSMRLARAFWVASFLVGVLVVAIAFLRRTTQFTDLHVFIRGLQPGYDTAAVDRAATLAFWGSLAALALFLLVEALLRPVTERRTGARWAMVVVLLGHAALAVGADPFIALGEAATYSRLLLGIQLLLAAAALTATALARRGEKQVRLRSR
jgi:hypothetical protein